jgi:CheY-like chemotaxis protein/signal transduction histidine kinase/HAMP domain-containing protein
MKRLIFKSIRTRLTYWFLLLTLIPLITVMVITYFQRVSVIEARTFDKLIAIRDLKVERLNDWLTERNADLHAIAGDKELTDLEFVYKNNSFNKNPKAIMENSRRILKRYLDNYPVYNEIFIINPANGKIMISTNRDIEGLNKSDNEYFIKPMQTKNICLKDIYYSKTLKENSMVYSMPIFYSENEEAHIVGILVARIDLNNTLYKMLLDRVGLGKTGETLIVNKDAIALNELRWYDNAPLNLQIKAKPAVDAAHGKTGIAVTTDYRGEDILAAFTNIPETGWGFVCKQDMYELNTPMRELIWNFVILFIIFAIIIFIISLFISNSISKPIIELNIATQKIKSGDYTIRTHISSTDELGSLSESINEMSESIESNITTQKGVANISETMIGKTSKLEFGNEMLKQLMEMCGANMSTFYILNEEESEYEHFVSVGANQELLKPFNAKNAAGEFGNAISKKEIYYLQNIPKNSVFKFKTIAGDLAPKEIITIPVLIETRVVALISLVSINKFSKECHEILKQSWTNINTSYSNMRAGEKTRILAESLTKTNQQLEAQSEELQEQADELHRSSEELQEQNLELEAQRNQVEEANQLKSEFLSNMSHELRTPLNSINALSQVLIMDAKDKLNDEENNFLEVIERNGKQLLSLINDILDLSKIEAGKMDILTQSVSIDSLLADIKENLHTLAENKGIFINMDFPDDIPFIETDESKLHQVITNIVSNAVKFTEKGNVTITVSCDTKNVFVEVKDTGIGISEKMLLHVFDEFRQADGSSARQYEGTGLGLAIAYKMIKVLGGDIQVNSKLNVGSVFTIIIPVKWNEEIIKVEPFNVITTPSKLVGNTILVIDDDPEIVKNISDYLNETGYETITATSGKEGLRLAEKHQPFAITLDIIMPEMDGFEVLQKLKVNSKTKDIPVIVISISDGKETGFALGAMGYIQKPVNKKLLISEIEKINEIPDSVMIVDDNDFELKQMAEIIEAENINTILAHGGEESLKLLDEKIPDILVLDLMMPGVDGFEVLDKIRKKPETQDLPVIIVTAKSITEKDKMQLSGKVSSLVAKSDTTPRDLYKEIERILKELEKSPKVKISGKITSETRILLVEDNNDAIMQMKLILERENYIVDVAMGGKEALDYIKHTIPDGIILDLMMPDIDGFEVLEKLRSTELTKMIPVVILTAKDLTHADLSKLSANNIQQLIHKGDVDIDELLFKVKLMLGNEPKFKTKDKRQKSKDNESTEGEKVKITQKKAIPVGIDGLANVLIVEDNPDNMITIKAIVKKKYNIAEAFDGEMGLKMAQSQKFDLILLDMSLPKMDGKEVVKNLKSNNETKNIQIIAVTALAMKGDKEDFLRAGCDGYISKPIDPKALLAEIESLLKKINGHK